MKREIVSITKEEKKILLEALDYKIDEKGVILDKNDQKVICPFTKRDVTIDKVSIMPGSLILMNTSPVTLSEYFYQYPDD